MLDRLTRDRGVGVVHQVAAQEILEAANMAGVGDVLEPGCAGAGDGVEIFRLREKPRAFCLLVQGQLAARNGLMMRRPSVSSMPCCISSDQIVSQPAWSAEAAIIAS